MLKSSLKPLIFNQIRKFNFRKPKPKELQLKPPEEDVIKPENEFVPNNPLSENDRFNAEYINRNPLNLEQMLLEIKPNGFPLDYPSVVYWNRLSFEKTSKHTTASVIHNSGRKIVSVSTKDWLIRKRLRSTIDNNAVVNIARVLALRCMQSGILYVHTDFTKKELETPKVQLLLKTIEEEGIITHELPAYKMDEKFL